MYLQVDNYIDIFLVLYIEIASPFSVLLEREDEAYPDHHKFSIEDIWKQYQGPFAQVKAVTTPVI